MCDGFLLPSIENRNEAPIKRVGGREAVSAESAIRCKACHTNSRRHMSVMCNIPNYPDFRRRCLMLRMRVINPYESL